MVASAIYKFHSILFLMPIGAGNVGSLMPNSLNSIQSLSRGHRVPEVEWTDMEVLKEWMKVRGNEPSFVSLAISLSITSSHSLFASSGRYATLRFTHSLHSLIHWHRLTFNERNWRSYESNEYYVIKEVPARSMGKVLMKQEFDKRFNYKIHHHPT